jgi:hypothetical protein
MSRLGLTALVFLIVAFSPFILLPIITSFYGPLVLSFGMKTIDALTYKIAFLLFAFIPALLFSAIDLLRQTPHRRISLLVLIVSGLTMTLLVIGKIFGPYLIAYALKDLRF